MENMVNGKEMENGKWEMTNGKIMAKIQTKGSVYRRIFWPQDFHFIDGSSGPKASIY